MGTPISVSVSVRDEYGGTAFEQRFVVPGWVAAAVLGLVELLAVALVIVAALAFAPPVLVGIVALALLFALPVVLPLLVVRSAGRF